MSRADAGVAASWAAAAACIVAGVLTHRHDVAAVAASLFLVTWLAVTVIGRRRQRARELLADARATRNYAARVRCAELPTPDPAQFAELMRAAGAPELEGR